MAKKALQDCIVWLYLNHYRVFFFLMLWVETQIHLNLMNSNGVSANTSTFYSSSIREGLPARNLHAMLIAAAFFVLMLVWRYSNNSNCVLQFIKPRHVFSIDHGEFLKVVVSDARLPSQRRGLPVLVRWSTTMITLLPLIFRVQLPETLGSHLQLTSWVKRFAVGLKYIFVSVGCVQD
jgi:hypothetical protein